MRSAGGCFVRSGSRTRGPPVWRIPLARPGGGDAARAADANRSGESALGLRTAPGCAEDAFGNIGLKDPALRFVGLSDQLFVWPDVDASAVGAAFHLLAADVVIEDHVGAPDPGT